MKVVEFEWKSYDYELAGCPGEWLCWIRDIERGKTAWENVLVEVMIHSIQNNDLPKYEESRAKFAAEHIRFMNWDTGADVKSCLAAMGKEQKEKYLDRLYKLAKERV